MAELAPTRDKGSRTGTPLLAVEGLEGWYGESHVLHGVTFDVREGEVVTLLGRNGAGKTTTLKAIMGVLGQRRGSVKFDGQEMIGLPSRAIARAGIAICPEERGIFSSLSVEENLLLPPQVKPGGMTVEQIYELFPNLKERLSSPGTKLSGGEQQMLAIGRALMAKPKLLLLDEPYEGLAPVIVQEIAKTLNIIRDQGMTTIIVEQNAVAALKLADRAVILDTGQVVYDDSAQKVLDDEALRAKYLAI